MIQQGKYSLAGFDLWATFGLAVVGKNSDWLQLPARKASVKYDYPDQNGIAIDLTLPVTADRSIAIQLVMSSSSLSDFNTKYQALLSLCVTPGLLALYVSDTGRTYQVYYTSMTNIVRNGLISGNCLTAFTLRFNEPAPNLT